MVLTAIAMAHEHSHKRLRVEDAAAAAGQSADAAAPLLASLPQPPSFDLLQAPTLDPTRYHHVRLPPPSSSSFALVPPALPVHLWALDPLFFSYAKLFIAHLQRLSPFPDLPSSTSLLSRPLTKVELVGVIVAREVRATYTAYTVDDSTGVIRVKVFANGSADTRPSPTLPGGVLAGAALREPLRLGQTVRCLGKVNVHFGEREVNAESVRVEKDSGAELLHWMECMTLYDRVYAHSSAIAKKHRRDCREQQQPQQEQEGQRPDQHCGVQSRTVV